MANKVRYPQRIHTPTATYERWSHTTHGEAFAEICTDPEVMEFLGGPATREYSLEGSRRMEDHWQTFGFGLWAVIAADSAQLAGFSGGCHPLWHPDLGRTPEIGWRLARWAWGRGYATTGGRMALDALGEAGFAEVISIIDPANHNSLAVVGRIGLRHKETSAHPQRGTPLEIYTNAP
jgi:RimJ/RimL family protein N-acetyltransferase